MKQWTTPSIDVLEISATAQGTPDDCNDIYNKGSYNGPGATTETVGVCS